MELWALLYFCGLAAAGVQNGAAAREINVERDLGVTSFEEPAPSICQAYTYTWAVTEGAPYSAPLYPSWAEPGYATACLG